MTHARIISILSLLALAPLAACGDDADPAGCEATGCEAWESCEGDGDCYPLLGRCNSALDCGGADETCNVDTHTCEALVTCNETKTPSTVVLDADTCGALTDCIDSSDCPSDQRCENLAISGETYARACCVPGLRGCGEVGVVCDDEYDCESGLCLSRNDGTTYCSRQCEGPADCVSPITECYDMVVLMACVEPQ